MHGSTGARMENKEAVNAPASVESAPSDSPRPLGLAVGGGGRELPGSPLCPRSPRLGMREGLARGPVSWTCGQTGLGTASASRPSFPEARTVPDPGREAVRPARTLVGSRPGRGHQECTPGTQGSWGRASLLTPLRPSTSAPGGAPCTALRASFPQGLPEVEGHHSLQQMTRAPALTSHQWFPALLTSFPDPCPMGR